MNLRKDHYRARAPRGRPPIRAYLTVLLWRAALAATGPRWCAPVRDPETLPLPYRLSETTIVKTFNNGSLGSSIDEERSEMR